MPNHHGRYPYSPITARPVYDWPDGKRLAVYIGLNLEWFAFGQGLGAELAPGGPQPDVLNYSWRDYGNRVGVFRLADLFDRLELPVSLLVNAEMCMHAPQAIDALQQASSWSATAAPIQSARAICRRMRKNALIDETTAAIHKHAGTRPTGWLGPWISQSPLTPDLLHEAGYTYLLDWCHDDQPVWMKTRIGRILSIPYPQELNDIPQIVARKREGDEFARMIVDAFDVMHAECEQRPLVMGIALHPYIVGWPHRFVHLARALETHSSSAPMTKCGSRPRARSHEHAGTLREGSVP